MLLRMTIHEVFTFTNGHSYKHFFSCFRWHRLFLMIWYLYFFFFFHHLNISKSIKYQSTEIFLKALSVMAFKVDIVPHHWPLPGNAEVMMQQNERGTLNKLHVSLFFSWLSVLSMFFVVFCLFLGTRLPKDFFGFVYL